MSTTTVDGVAERDYWRIGRAELAEVVFLLANELSVATSLDDVKAAAATAADAIGQHGFVSFVGGSASQSNV